MSAIRSIVAVVLGVGVTVAAGAGLLEATLQDPRVFPGWRFVLLSTMSVAAFSLLGGYAAARVAGGREAAHGLAVALLLILAAGASMIVDGSEGSRWVPLGVILAAAPAAAIGGLLRGLWARGAAGE